MDFKKIIDMQIRLDKDIEATHNVVPKEVIVHKVVALIVEIGEFANEIQPFKYWKKKKNIDRKKVVEEFVDGIHFLLSLSIYLQADTLIEPIVTSECQVQQLADLFIETSKLKKDLSKEQVEKAFGLYMGMAKLIDLSDKEIEEFYIEKNKVNFERLAAGY